MPQLRVAAVLFCVAEALELMADMNKIIGRKTNESIKDRNTKERKRDVHTVHFPFT